VSGKSRTDRHGRCEQRSVSACSVVARGPAANVASTYAHCLKQLAEDGVPFLVGGAVLLAAHAGIRRNTKDLDLFVIEQDLPRTLAVLSRAGLRTETPFPHWLAKAYAEERVIDVIFNSGNGNAPVDREWFEHASPGVVCGTPVQLCPVEETIWSKAFVMERERFDGADVAHLLLHCCRSLDWQRLMRRFGDHWRVLFSHLVLFGYVFPDEASRIPQWVMRELTARLHREEESPPGGRICRGTLLSREQYLSDLARGWQDARLPPFGSMSAEAVAIWTEAIARK
jgi:hypothetical protein